MRYYLLASFIFFCYAGLCSQYPVKLAISTIQGKNQQHTLQPQYFKRLDEKLMNHPVGYTNKDQYQSWLECGIKAFNNNKTGDALTIH